MFYFLINSEDSRHHHIVCTRRPDFPAPSMRTMETTIPGRSGNFIRYEGTYEDIVVDQECNYITNPNNWHQAWRDIKRWMLKPEIREFSYSDDLNYYYRLKKVDLGTNEREFRHTASFTVSLTFSPYEYLVSGKRLYDVEECMLNMYDTCRPIYYIEGEGMCTLTVNGNEMTANVGQNLTIDTELKLAYRTDGTAQNTNVTGDFDDMVLINGTNEISVSSGFRLKIRPNWRCI